MSNALPVIKFFASRFNTNFVCFYHFLYYVSVFKCAFNCDLFQWWYCALDFRLWTTDSFCFFDSLFKRLTETWNVAHYWCQFLHGRWHFHGFVLAANCCFCPLVEWMTLNQKSSWSTGCIHQQNKTHSWFQGTCTCMTLSLRTLQLQIRDKHLRMNYHIMCMSNLATL